MRNLDILAAENGEHVRVLLCREEQSYVVSCQHFRMPYPVASDLLAELQPVPAETYSVFVLDEDITNRQREGRNRKLDLIAPLLEDACIYDKSHRNEVVRQIAAEHGIARRTVLQYLWRYWVYQSKNALLPAERPAPEQHELTADEKAIRWALNKYYYTPQRQSLQTAYKMMLRAKYCDTHGTLKPEYPTFWQFRYFFRKNRDLISETISRQGLKAYQRNHRPFTGSVCDYAHTIGVYMTDATIADIYIVSRLSRKPIGRPVIYTMVDAYARFFPTQRKRSTYAYVVNGNPLAVHRMGISQANGNHCPAMRYCPVCYQEDLQLYGEPYWHRSHQLPDMQICTKHRCWLVDTDVAYNSTRQQELFPASFTMQLKKQSAEPVPGCLLALDSLLHDTLDSSFDYRDGSVYHAVLDCALRSRGWRSLTGGRTYAAKIETALLSLYGSYVPTADISTKQLHATLCNKSVAPRYVLQLAVLLGLSLHDLLHAPDAVPDYKAEMKAMYQSGASMYHIAQLYGTDAKTVARWVKQ